MRIRKQPLTPLATIAAGLAAGAVGTICMDTLRYVRYRRAGGKDSPLGWEFAPVDSWDKAPDPGQIGKRLIEGFTQRELSDRWAFPVSTVMHWGYGSGAGMAYGVLAGSLRKPHAVYGVPYGAAVFASDYVTLPIAGLYQPIWKYDAKTLWEDLSAHLAYGAGTGVTFWLISKVSAA
jgi:hypothetical protein